MSSLFFCHERRVAKREESNGLNLYSRISKIVEQSLGHLLITSSSSHFFSKTDLEQYLFHISSGELWDYVLNKCVAENECSEPVRAEELFSTTATTASSTSAIPTNASTFCPLGSIETNGQCIRDDFCVDKNGAQHKV